ncbi:hypothetical protein [Bifidobacterium eulemuris]|uniref:Cation efflux system protein n=2 Tax=Bifidobacterium eulemuris TaxID=1765219 RepID=A0A261GCB2_9BIFI|nr:hypothetical protein [Bifidobacterium eulemuris]OZG69081.1 cation efflux system protein [Bifidobacterium eulemuris]QOL31395.1 hypothetical protein BE0216_02175 [Bifidobacterium eulemuris]
MKHGNVLMPLARAVPLAKLAMLACTALAITTYTLSYARPDLEGRWQQVMLNTNILGYNLIPLFLLLLCFGSTRFSSFERVRTDPRSELRLNLIWMLVAALLTSLLPALAAIIAWAITPQTPSAFLSSSLAPLPLIIAQVFMELTAIGLAAFLPISAGISWGFVAPPFIIVFALADWVFSAAAPRVLDWLFLFTLPVHTASQLIQERVLPFLVLFAMLIAANAIAHARRDHLKE